MDTVQTDDTSQAAADSAAVSEHATAAPIQEEGAETGSVGEEDAPDMKMEGLEVIDDSDQSPQESEAETPKMAHDSMVTVRLSEPPSLTLDTLERSSQQRLPRHSLSSSEPNNRNSDIDPPSVDDATMTRMNRTTLSLIDTSSRSLQDELGLYTPDGHDSDSSDMEEVNWEQLEKTEGEQTKDDETDNSTALLLARLEQENAKLATNPKTAKVQAVERLNKPKTRPPSMAMLRQMVNEPAPATLRYSMVPPPPMTDLEFYAALVKDYQQTAARLPTLVSNKIRKGVPPPLRGVVWQSMSGARDPALEAHYDRLSGESSPYELLIGKDLGRSFPGVDMFRDADGEGQQMLGRVLKCFSLYDTKIGYCQGLAFLVGPLLMHMPDKQAFCVLVRLMEQYDLRACFLPDLSGLHVRIYQFRELLRQNLPGLAAHMEELQVETAYVSQWFLSFFAVTCPLPMLFRIYDVLFAEGASETLMRVALSLMRKNEARLLACTELEDVMHLLLSRGLWDCYHYDADEFVHDFASLSGAVTREKLSQLEQGYKESLIATVNAARVSDITTAASRFLGRLWASGKESKSANLTPSTSASGQPLNSLKRSTSKQSLASTLNSIEASSASATSSFSTDETTVSRNSTACDSTRESTPVGPKLLKAGVSTDERYLHSQIEDLLTALTELQRNQALLSNQLQREREERDEDRRAVGSLLDGLRKKASNYETGVIFEATEEDIAAAEEPNSRDQSDEQTPGEEVGTTETEGDGDDNDNGTPMSDATEKAHETQKDATQDAPSAEDLEELLDRVERRFAASEGNKHRSSLMMTKSQMREELMHAKGELAVVSQQCQDLNRRVYDMDLELTSLKEELRDRHNQVKLMHQDKQRLEKQLSMLKTAPPGTITPDSGPGEADFDMGAGKNGLAGLKELKLGRSRSIPNVQPAYGKRISSMPMPKDAGGENAAEERETLLLELVQAKTAEATAKQEAEEMKQKLEALRKSYGIGPVDSPSASAASAAMGVFSRLAGQSTTSAEGSPKRAAATSDAAATGGFWGWRR